MVVVVRCDLCASVCFVAGVFTAFVCLLLRVVDLRLVLCMYLHVYVVVCVLSFL